VVFLHPSNQALFITCGIMSQPVPAHVSNNSDETEGYVSSQWKSRGRLKREIKFLELNDSVPK
jgi:hypothetical protein